MTLRYYFDDEEFEYELEYSDIYEYFNGVPNETLKEYLETEYNNMTEREQSEILNELLEDSGRNLIKRRIGTNITFVPNFENLIEDDKSWCIDTFLYDNLDQYEDELKQYFEDEAREEASQGSDREEREAEYIDMITPVGGWN